MNFQSIEPAIVEMFDYQGNYLVKAMPRPRLCHAPVARVRLGASGMTRRAVT